MASSSTTRTCRSGDGITTRPAGAALDGSRSYDATKPCPDKACADEWFLKSKPYVVGPGGAADLQPLAYRRRVRAEPGVSSVLLPVGQGLEVSRTAGPDDVGL